MLPISHILFQFVTHIGLSHIECNCEKFLGTFKGKKTEKFMSEQRPKRKNQWTESGK